MAPRPPAFPDPQNMPWPTVASSTGGEVEVWLIACDQPPNVVAGLTALLDEDERARAALRSLAGHRDRYAVAHGAARMIIGYQLGVEPSQISWRYGPNGKPELAGGPDDPPQVNLSHSGPLAALALAHNRPVGVDVQEFPPGLDPVRFARRYFPPDEARFVADGSAPGSSAADGSAADGSAADGTANATDSPAASAADQAAGDAAAGQMKRFVRLWARKEACVKVSGGRLMQGMRLLVQGEDHILVTDPTGALPVPCLARDVPVPPGFGAAVAAAGTEPFGVRVLWWPSDLTD